VHTALAKQLGYTDKEIEALRFVGERSTFSPEIQAAVCFAEKVARDPHEVSDEDFRDLRQHYTEPEVVELATVVSLTCYFNKFNSALRVDLPGSDTPCDS